MLALTAGPRSIKSGKEFDKFFPFTLLRTDPIVIRSGSVEDSLRVMAQVAENYKSDTAQISQRLRSADLNVTCKNIWSFIYTFIQYREDEQGVEQIRRPGRSWNDRTTGVDCDCMSVFASSILRNLNIPHFYRITKYNKAEFQHVYVIVPNNLGTTSGYFTIDGVIDGYDKEKQFTECKDFDMNGIPIQLLNGLVKVAVDPLYEYLLQLQQICSKALEKQIPISKGIACCDAGDLLGYAISNWKNPADRAVALQNNVQLEEKNWPELSFWRTVWNYLQGNATVQDIYENTFTVLPPANPALGGYADPFWINFFSSAGSNATTTPPASGGSTSFDWSDLFKFSSDTLNIISNWGKNVATTPPSYVTPPVTTTATTGGINNTTLLVIGALIAVGGIIYYSTKSSPMAPKQIPANWPAKPRGPGKRK